MRFGNLFFPPADRPENYSSLISNGELQSLMVQQYFSAINSNPQSFAEFLMEWSRMWRLPLNSVFGRGHDKL